MLFKMQVYTAKNSLEKKYMCYNNCYNDNRRHFYKNQAHACIVNFYLVSSLFWNLILNFKTTSLKSELLACNLRTITSKNYRVNPK